jgi:hypothetical protein
MSILALPTHRVTFAAVTFSGSIAKQSPFTLYELQMATLSVWALISSWQLSFAMPLAWRRP